jgi:hypothetical protein
VGGGVKMAGLPLSAGGHTVGALHKSITLPDCPPNAGTTGGDRQSKGNRHLPHLPCSDRFGAILALERSAAMAI